MEAGHPIDAVADLLEQVMPLDDERLTEAKVWAAFTAPPVTDPEIAEIRQQVDDGIRQLCRNALLGLRELDQVHPSRDLDVETERIYALVDGLTLHMLLDPEGVRAARVRSALVTHLNDLQSAAVTSGSGTDRR